MEFEEGSVLVLTVGMTGREEERVERGGEVLERSRRGRVRGEVVPVGELQCTEKAIFESDDGHFGDERKGKGERGRELDASKWKPNVPSFHPRSAPIYNL